MKTSILLAAFLAIPCAALAQAPATPPASTGTVVEKSSEYRFQMDFQVTQAALNKLLPAGWESMVAAQGAAKDCNLRIIFVERSDIVGPNNRVLGKGKDLVAYLEAPVKQSGGTMTGRMVVGGISANNPAGLVLAATKSASTRSTATADGNTTVSEDWDFAAAGGEHLSLHVQYHPLPANISTGETRFYDPADPAKVTIARAEQATDITRNNTTNPPDRVTQFSYKAGGGKFAALFDGTEKPLSWDSQPVYSRTIVTP